VEATPVIRLRELTLYTHHGVPAAERETGQRMLFDLDLYPVSCEAAISDDVSGTIDYGEVVELVAGIATGQSFHTLERLVTVIAETVLKRFPLAGSVLVRATKPVPPIAFTVGGASVEVTMRREDSA